MKVDLTNHSFEDIRIKNTSLIDANFIRCNVSGSVIENVDIGGVNLNGALLLNASGKTLKYMNLTNWMVKLVMDLQYVFLQMELHQLNQIVGCGNWIIKSQIRQ